MTCGRLAREARVELPRMHPPVAAHPEDGFALRPDRRPRASEKMAQAGSAPAGFPWLRLSAGCGAVIAVLASFAQQQEPPAPATPSAPVQPSAASLPVWTPVARALPIYEIDAPRLKPLPFAITARRDAAGAREDTLTFGAFDREGEPHLRIVLHRLPHPERTEPSLFLDLARRASGAALAVVRSTPPEGLATKFGVMEVSEATLSDNSERLCLGFRFSHHEIGFRIAGWLCPAQGQAMGQAIDRQELACTIDRLSLAEAGNDEPLKNLFAQADRQRIGGCTPAPIVDSLEPRSGEGAPNGRSPPRQARPRAQVPVTGGQKGSATLPRGPARGAGNASPNNRG